MGYHVEATFGGYHAEATSPKVDAQLSVQPTWYDPIRDYTNNSAYYIVFSCPPGSAWINEVNPRGYLGNTNQEFVEVCGVAGSDLSGWGLDNVGADGLTQAVYRLSSGTVLANENNGFGFWVIGGSTVVSRDMSLTTKLGYPGGVRLRRSMGAYEHAVCFGDSIGSVATLTNLGFIYLTSDPFSSTKGISATGTGSTARDFTNWVNSFSLTPGLTNINQVLIGYGPTPEPPQFMIYAIRMNTNVWLECTGTNGWFATPWYTTNLTVSNSWLTVPGVTKGLNASNCVLNFPIPTNQTPYFYKIVATNSP